MDDVQRCGSEEGLDAGRHCLNRWGYRRCEDIVWIKTNNDPDRKYVNAANQEALSVLQHTKVGEWTMSKIIELLEHLYAQRNG